YFFRIINDVHKNIIYYLIAMLSVDILGRGLWKLLGHNLIVLPIFSFIELLFFLIFYNKFLIRRRPVIFGLGTIGLVYILIEIFVNFVFYEIDRRDYQPYAKVVDNFIVILMSLTFFQEKIDKFKE